MKASAYKKLGTQWKMKFKKDKSLVLNNDKFWHKARFLHVDPFFTITSVNRV